MTTSGAGSDPGQIGRCRLGVEDAPRPTPSTRRLRDAVRAALRDGCSTQATAPKKKKKYVYEYQCRCKDPERRCPGYNHFLGKGDLMKANKHYNEKNAAGAWVKAVPPAGDPVEWIKLPAPKGGAR